MVIENTSRDWTLDACGYKDTTVELETSKKRHLAKREVSGYIM